MNEYLECEDCGELYRNLGIDTSLSDEQWLLIHPEGEGGILCANCILKRATDFGFTFAEVRLVE